jgi:hypothetical protein
VDAGVLDLQKMREESAVSSSKVLSHHFLKGLK